MTKRKAAPARTALQNPRAAGQSKSSGPASARPETIEQARRWDVQKSRALAFGLCDRCAAQFAWGLQIGFAKSRPPCASCAQILAVAVGERRPNGWTNVRLENVGTDDTRYRSDAYRSRNTTPAKYREGYGTCLGCEAFWTGFSTCHCSGCHTTYIDERAFSRHRVRGRCHDPESRGLVKITRAHWTGWGWPKQRDRFERKG